MNLSVVIIAFNEEKNIERCLKSLPEGCEIIVVDSYSTDRTLELADKLGAKVHQKEFKSFDTQKNFGVSLAEKDWILSLDADESLTSDLVYEISQTISKPSMNVAFRLTRRLDFMGRVLRYGKTKDRPMRLFKSGFARFEGKIHEKLVVSKGSTGLLNKGYILHRSYRDLTDYFDRFNRYTSKVAESHIERGDQASKVAHIVRPWFEFFMRYFIRLGFLDGYPGYVYALNSSLYAFTKYSKFFECRALREHDRGN